MNDNDKIQSEGRNANAAAPLNASDNKGGAERYPKVRRDDAVTGEDRSFQGSANPEPPQGAGDGSIPPAANDGRAGPAGDPAEGKR